MSNPLASNFTNSINMTLPSTLVTNATHLPSASKLDWANPNQDYICCFSQLLANMPPLPQDNTTSKILFFKNHISPLFATCERHDFDYHNRKNAIYHTAALFLSGQIECREFHCNQKPEPPMIIYALILIATLLVAVCGNIFSCSIIIKIRSLRRHATY